MVHLKNILSNDEEGRGSIIQWINPTRVRALTEHIICVFVQDQLIQFGCYSSLRRKGRN